MKVKFKEIYAQAYEDGSWDVLRASDLSQATLWPHSRPDWKLKFRFSDGELWTAVMRAGSLTFSKG